MDDPTRGEEGGIPAATRPQGQRSSITSFLFISFVLFIITNRNGDEFLARHQYKDALRSLTYQLSNYTAWMNGTASNFTVVSILFVSCPTYRSPHIKMQPDRDPAVTPLLDSFTLRGGKLDPARASYYSNITGFIHGDAKYHNITPSYLSNSSTPAIWEPMAESYMAGTNMTDLVNRVGTWNWTASNKVALSVVEKRPLQTSGNGNVSEDIALVHVGLIYLMHWRIICDMHEQGRIELTDANTSEDLRLEFEGVHFVANGSIYGFAEPNGYVNRICSQHVDEIFLYLDGIQTYGYYRHLCQKRTKTKLHD